MKRTLLIAAIAAALLGLSSTPAKAQISIGVQYGSPWAEPAPPPPQAYQPPYQPEYQQDYSYEAAPPPPAPVWVDGYQQWNGYRYVWFPGHWEHRGYGGGWDRHHHGRW